MSLEEYEAFVQGKLIGAASRERFALALAEEVGELAGKVKRIHRGDYGPGAPLEGQLREAELGELGDILFYVTAYAYAAGLTMQSVVQFNVAKLDARQAAGALLGEGDAR